MDKNARAQLRWSLIVGAILAFAYLLASYGEAEANFMDALESPLELREVGLTYRNYFPGQRDPILMESALPNEEPGQEFLLTLDVDILRFGYLDNNIHGLMERDPGGPVGQFRTMGWEFRYGVRPLPWLEFGYYHHSQHLLDNAGTVPFPSESGLELHVIFFQKPAPRESLF